MSLRPTSHLGRSAAVTLATVGLAGGLFAGLAGAANAQVQPAGYTTVDSCTSVSGSIHYSPGLRKLLQRQTSAVLSGTTSGCSDAFSGPMSGSGSFTAILSGKVSLAAENFSGTFTINWPGGTLNPSNGTLAVNAQGNQQYLVTGTVTGGADTGTVLSFGYLTTSQTGTGTKLHPVTSQQFVNTAPLALARNFG